jgi:competence protein ComEC
MMPMVPRRWLRQDAVMHLLNRFLRPVAGAAFGLTAVLACWSAHQFETLLSPTIGAVALFCGLVVLLAQSCLTRQLPGCVLLVAVFALFFASTHWRAQAALDERIDPDDEGRNIEIIGIVEDLPIFIEHGVRFGLRVERCISEQLSCRPDSLYRLGWYFSRERETRKLIESLKPGQRLHLQVRLKQVHALANPGLFDAELRALEDGVAARGYVRSANRIEPSIMSITQALTHPMILVNQLRFRLRETMRRAMSDSSEMSRSVMIALVVGDQSAIGASGWELFNRTGIGHLISISGLHITMLAGLAHQGVTRIWRSKRLFQITGLVLARTVSTPIAARLVAVAVAFGYSALAGWGVPAQRTCWMLTFALLASLGNRGGSALNIVAAALLAVLILDPWSVLAAGFWLSFAAVAAIVWYGSAGVASTANRSLLKGLIDALRAQWAVSIALVPLGALFFASVSLISPIANSFAIPVVSFVITPLALAGALLVLVWPWLGSLLLNFAALCFDFVQWLIELLDRFEYAVFVLPNPDMLAVLLSASGIFVLLSRLLPGRCWGLVTLLPILGKPALVPSANELWLTAIDVGQGMAVLIETAQGRLLYDTGPAYSSDSDAGQRVVAPYLRSRGITRLDVLAISHKDVDHSGGAASIVRVIKVGRLITSISSNEALLENARARQIPIDTCRRGEGWTWGEVQFEWLHPDATASDREKASSNSKSCVLKISSSAGSALLAGDIEAAQERALLRSVPEEKLRADILLAPHHGSQTSSTAAFLDAVAPTQVIFQVGYRNRFKHPNPKVWRRYASTDAELLRSDWHGAIQIRMRSGEAPITTRYRLDSPKYWRVCVDPEWCGQRLDSNKIK